MKQTGNFMYLSFSFPSQTESDVLFLEESKLIPWRGSFPNSKHNFLPLYLKVIAFVPEPQDDLYGCFNGAQEGGIIACIGSDYVKRVLPSSFTLVYFC